MTTIRIICAAVIILGFGFAGFRFAAELNKAAAEIHIFSALLRDLEAEITIRGSVLGDALLSAAGLRKSVPASIFRTAAELLRTDDMSPEDAFLSAYKKHRGDLASSRYTDAIIAEFSHGLSGETSRLQADNIETALRKLSQAEHDADEKRRRDASLYRSLGIAGGMLAALLLI